MTNKIKMFTFMLLLLVTPLWTMAGDDHGVEDGDEKSEGVELSSSQIKLAEIKIAALEARPITYQIYAPGEVLANAYTSYLISARVDSVVLQRHTSLGDHVKQGQPLVTLFSETVAEAQAAFRVANAEYVRVKKLGRKNVGEKRFFLVQNDFEVSHSRLLAYGLSEKDIEDISTKEGQIGEYTLVATADGAVLFDDFRQGQRVEAGEPLMDIACEKELWIEARLAPNAKINVVVGARANVKIGDNFYVAEVIQEARTIDEVTRTRVVRLRIDNADHKLHPGQYADVYFSFITDELVLAVPETALMRGGDGDWLIFIEEDGHYVPHEVERGRALGELREISGIISGLSVVMEGAFFVASEQAKSGFDPHNH